MSSPDGVSTQQLARDHEALMRSLLAMLGRAFGDAQTYCGIQPGPGYLRRLLASDAFIALAALKNGEVAGGLGAYELRKFEQERSDLYIYDLASGRAQA